AGARPFAPAGWFWVCACATPAKATAAMATISFACMDSSGEWKVAASGKRSAGAGRWAVRAGGPIPRLRVGVCRQGPSCSATAQCRMADQPPGKPEHVVEFGKSGTPAAATDGRLDAPAFHRNHAPIWSVLSRFLRGRSGAVLEIGSGTGQHVAEFAGHSPTITWWPSDILDTHLRSIDAWR